MSLAEFAKEELEREGLFSPESDYNGMIGRSVLELVETLAGQGHSGFSADLTLRLFGLVSRYIPISPLTGEDDEWVEVSEELFQNKRCFSVFKNRAGEAWNVDARILRADGTIENLPVASSKTLPVTFPYDPTRVYPEGAK